MSNLSSVVRRDDGLVTRPRSAASSESAPMAARLATRRDALDRSRQRRDTMKGKTIGLLLAGALLGATLPAYVWWRLQSESPRPTAKTPAEARVLGVLDQMVAGGGTHLPIDTDDGRTL